VLKNGQKVTTAQMWWEQRRPEIVEDFDREIYGRVPRTCQGELGSDRDETGNQRRRAGHYQATRRPRRQLLVPGAHGGYPPDTDHAGQGNRASAGDDGVRLHVWTRRVWWWSRRRLQRAAPKAAAPPAGRGGFGGGGPSWQQQVLARGWGYAILIPNSIQADNGAGLTQGIIGLVNKGQPRKPDDWGALRAWAWAPAGLDYFETDKAVDARQVGIEGLSRYGKAALVAMAYDQRFASVSSAPPAPAAPSFTAATGANSWKTSPAAASTTGWPATSSSTADR